MKKILFAASECVPFVKTGGLADVVGALPKYFNKEEYDVRVIIPCYTMIPETYRKDMQYVTHFYSYFNGRDRYVGVKQLELNGVLFYFIDNEEYYSGKSPYTEYRYDVEKFCFFCKAVLSVLPSLNFRPDVIHCHDWHSGLIPVYLKTEFSQSEFYQGIRTIMTIHNLKFQGNYNYRDMSAITGLPQELFTIDKLLTYEDGNMLKGGLCYADRITTVSPSYREEIMTAEYGEKLEGLFYARRDSFSGILNGIDFEVYDPANDPTLAAPYSAKAFLRGKAACKKALQKELGLKEDPKAMVLGIVSRLTDQKGFDMVAEILPGLYELPVQLVVLGTGDPRFEEVFRKAHEEHPEQVSASFFYSEEFSHRIYAGCDAFLMPSRFEPCGLSQLIALRYGTLPLVRETGGLKDTVVPYNAYTGEGTGFSFKNCSSEELYDTLIRALELYRSDAAAWKQLVRQALSADFSWNSSARTYEALYDELLK